MKIHVAVSDIKIGILQHVRVNISRNFYNGGKLII